MEYRHSGDVQPIMDALNASGAEIADLEVSRVTDEEENHYYAAVFSVQVQRSILNEQVIPAVTALENVMTVEEM